MTNTNLSAKTLPDVQSERDFRGRAIQKVGVTNVRFPFCFGAADSSQATIGHWNLFVSLGEDKRGTHMSRFLQILSDIDEAQTTDTLFDVCEKMRERLEAGDAFLNVRFPYFIEKAAPATGSVGKVDFDVEIEISRGTKEDTLLTVKIPATSLCPCSKKISDYGAHNQRCELMISVKFVPGKSIGLEELFLIAEASASSKVYSVLKREDEKFVTELAYDNPKFVEDAVRDLANTLEADERIEWFRCSSENFESIHSHNAYAVIESGNR